MSNWIQTPESSNIAGFGYNEEQSILTVEFNRGGTYDYYNVPVSIFESMKNASSKGEFLASHVKGHFRYAKQ